MRRVTLATRRARQFLRRPPQPRWLRPATYVGGALAGLLLGLGAGGWATSSGLLARTGDAVVSSALAVTVDAGLTLREVYVDGRVRTDPEELRQHLAIALGTPLLAIDTAAARARLEALTWVEQASVVRMLPGSLYIRLIERQPLALWQRDGRFSLVDRAGRVIEGALDEGAPASWRHLRVLVGEGAPARAAGLFALLSTEPALSERVVAASWVGERRWSLHLDNRIDVLLPEHDPHGAWRVLAAKERQQALLERAVAVIDLRFLPGRIRLRLDPRGLDGQELKGHGA
jgi:cell division protein FtsQ